MTDKPIREGGTAGSAEGDTSPTGPRMGDARPLAPGEGAFERKAASGPLDEGEAAPVVKEEVRPHKDPVVERRAADLDFEEGIASVYGIRFGDRPDRLLAVEL